MTPVKPLHTGTVNGRPVRFFRSLRPTPNLPFHVVSDLCLAVAWPPQPDRYLIDLRRRWGRFLETVFCEGEVLITAPHFTASELLAGLDAVGVLPRDVPQHFQQESILACLEQTKEMTPQEKASFSLMAIKAHDRQAGEAR